MPRPEKRVGLSGARRVLVIRHRAGGDLILSTPTLRALRAALPGSSIEVIAARGMSEILDGNPDVDRVLEFDRCSFASQAALYAGLLRGGYDWVLDMVSNPRSAVMTALTRASVRVGYDLPGRRYAYTLRIPREPLGPAGPLLRYAPEAGLDLVRAVGIEPRGLELTFRVSPKARRRMDLWLEESGLLDRPIVACLPAGSWASKTWPPERFAASMEALRDEANALWLWGPGEEALARECRSTMRGRAAVAPRTGWQDLGALLSRCALLVSNDSGPKHLAVALGIPTVTLFGPTHPATWHPPDGPHTAISAEGLECLHCNETQCPLLGERHMRCMRDLTVMAVVDACRALLQRSAGRAACENR